MGTTYQPGISHPAIATVLNRYMLKLRREVATQALRSLAELQRKNPTDKELVAGIKLARERINRRVKTIGSAFKKRQNPKRKASKRKARR